MSALKVLYTYGQYQDDWIKICCPEGWRIKARTLVYMVCPASRIRDSRHPTIRFALMARFVILQVTNGGFIDRVRTSAMFRSSRKSPTSACCCRQWLVRRGLLQEIL